MLSFAGDGAVVVLVVALRFFTVVASRNGGFLHVAAVLHFITLRPTVTFRCLHGVSVVMSRFGGYVTLRRLHSLVASRFDGYVRRLRHVSTVTLRRSRHVSMVTSRRLRAVSTVTFRRLYFDGYVSVVAFCLSFIGGGGAGREMWGGNGAVASSPPPPTNKGAAYNEIQLGRRKLPAYARREDILEAINNNQVIVISGETGCGKTTQVRRRRCAQEGEGEGGCGDGVSGLGSEGIDCLHMFFFLTFFFFWLDVCCVPRVYPYPISSPPSLLSLSLSLSLSRSIAPFRKGCLVNRRITKANNKMSTPPSHPPHLISFSD